MIHWITFCVKNVRSYAHIFHFSWTNQVYWLFEIYVDIDEEQIVNLRDIRMWTMLL